MPVRPICLLEPIWAQFVVLLPHHPAVAPAHPLGYHRKRIPDRVVFDHVVAALVHGSGYKRIATPGCSDRTIRRRMRAWAEAGAAEQLHAKVLAQYDRLIGLSSRSTAAPPRRRAAGSGPGDLRWIAASRVAHAPP